MTTPPERRPKYRPDISLGNILTIIGMIIAGFTAWLDVRTTQTAILSEASDFERRLEILERSETQRHTDRINQVTLFTEIRTDIKYLREAVERIEDERRR
ncbi:hypothetical protein LP7551_02050 [Roseibium album]|nr:hypothetical protein LP7551_02050 [Roseibium album]